jgi:Glycosyl hydrolase family 26
MGSVRLGGDMAPPARWGRRWVAAIIASSIVAGTLFASLAGQSAGAAHDMHWGARVDKGDNPTDLGALDEFEASVGRELGVVRIFALWEQAWPDSYAQRLAANDQIPLLSVKPKRNNGTVVTWAAIASAAPGSALYNEIAGWATKAKTFTKPMYFTFHHESEATANLPYGTAADFIAAWRKVVEVFRSKGVTNAKYLWIATDFSFGAPSTERRAAAKWYPGDAWVDAIGADAYNWVNCRSRNEGWRSLQQIIEPLRQFGLAHPTKELWLPEFATVEDAAVPTRKAQWMNDAAALFKQSGWEQFYGVAYFHYLVSGFPNCLWYADSSPASLQAFAAMGADSFYGGQPSVTPDEVLFVVGSPAAPTAGESAATARLTAANKVVAYADDDTVTVAMADSSDLVLISSTVSSGMGARLRDTSAPVIVWKPWIYDDMKLTGIVSDTDYTNATTSSVTIVLAAHPMAAGKSGSVTIGSSQTIGVGKPAVGAEVIAASGAFAALFVYESSAAMVGGFVAPACRIAFPSGTTAFSSMSTDGLGLFDAATNFALDGCTAP